MGFSNGVIQEWVLYASDGSDPSFLTAIDLRSGRVLFKQRGIPRAFPLSVGGDLLLLAEDGGLRHARPSSRGVDVLGSFVALQAVSWSAPVRVAGAVYLRDRGQIRCLAWP